MNWIKFKELKLLLITIVIYLVVLFIGGEIIMRYFFADSANEVKYIIKNGFYTYPVSDEINFINEDGVNIQITTDKFGLRNLNTDLEKNIIVLGDSFISAINTENDKTFAANLFAYNAGVDGYSTFQSLRLLNMLLEEKKPKIVILGFYLGNDFRDNYLENDQELLYSFDNKLNENKISLKHRIKNLLKKSKLIYKLYYLAKGLKNTPSMESYSASEIYSYWKKPNAEFNVALKNTEKAFKILEHMSKEYGFKVSIVGIPSKSQVYKSFKEITHYESDKTSRDLALFSIKQGFDFDRPDKLINQLSQKFNFQYISLLSNFRDQSFRKLYYYVDSHWTYIGQKIASDFVSDNLN